MSNAPCVKHRDTGAVQLGYRSLVRLISGAGLLHLGEEQHVCVCVLGDKKLVIYSGLIHESFQRGEQSSYSGK